MKLEQINEWQEIYLENKRLDTIFNDKYASDTQIYEKNSLEFLVELGEFINETKCFKYWSIKKPNKNKVLEEFADCLTMILYFYGINDLKIEENLNNYYENNLLDTLNHLYFLGTKLMHEATNEIITCIFATLIYVSKLLDLSESEIINSIKYKHKIVDERLHTDY